MWTMDVPSEPVVAASKFAEELKQKLELGWKLAASNLKKAQKRHVSQYNKKAKNPNLESGDKVFL